MLMIIIEAIELFLFFSFFFFFFFYLGVYLNNIAINNYLLLRFSSMMTSINVNNVYITIINYLKIIINTTSINSKIDLNRKSSQ